MLTKMLGEIKEVAPYVTPAEALVKLVIVLLFIVPVPIVALALGGFWLDYYRLNTLPILTVLGIVTGSLASFLGVCKVITYGHKRETKNG